ncbi:MAG: hypothetical protein SPE82_01500 [Succinivibrio sp.]|nr:hypothetical protein [Succinivibrio sp.]MDY6260590.1 hypothetical protein [Succinivibrio sp.]
MNEQNTEVEIDLVRLFRFILSKYKILLITGIVFAALACAYKFCRFEFSSTPLEDVDKLFTIERVVKEPDGKIVKKKEKVSYRLYAEDFDAQQSEYQTKISDAKNVKKVLASEIKVLENGLKGKHEYLEKSKLYGLDPASYWEADFYYNIREKNAKSTKTNAATVRRVLENKGNDANANSADQLENESTVVKFANNLLFTQKYVTLFADALGLKLEYTKEPVYELVGFNAVDSYSFVISLKGDSKDTVTSLEKVKEIFDKEFTEFFNSEYVIRTKQISFENTYNPSLIKLKEDKDSAVTNDEKAIDAKRNQISNTVLPVPPEDDKLVTLEAYKAKKLVVFAAAGFAFGLFICIVIFGMKYLFSGRLNSKDYLKDLFKFENIAVLHEAAFFKEEPDEIEKLKESLELLSKDKKSIAIVSTLEKKEIDNAVSIIEKVMNAKGISVKVLKDYNIKQISECDATLVCEKLDVSVLEKCVNEFETLKTYKLEVLGIVYA